MEISIKAWKWRPTSEVYSRLLYANLIDIEVHWVVKIFGIIAFLVFWTIGMIIIASLFLVLDMLLSGLSSIAALKSWFYGAIVGVMLLYPLVGDMLNLSWFYSKVANYPMSGPDPLACLKEYKYERYATAKGHERMIRNVLDTMSFMNDVAEIDQYIQKVAPGSPVKGYMVRNAADKYQVDPRLMIALMHIDSHFGLYGRAARTKNPGNVGNDDAGNNKYFKTWDAGVEAVAKWLDKNRKIMTSSVPLKNQDYG